MVNRRGMMKNALLTVVLSAFALGTYAERSQAQPEPRPDIPGLPDQAKELFQIGPIPGITTGWHRAPGETGIPLGTKVELKLAAPEEISVSWSGAVETERTEFASTAEVTFSSLGRHEVRVTAERWDKLTATKSCVFEVLDLSVEDVTLEPVSVAVPDLDIDLRPEEGEFIFRSLTAPRFTDAEIIFADVSPNSAIVDRWFADESIAQLTELGPDSYATSIDRTIQASLRVTPPELTPLMEWRINQRPTLLGGRFERRFPTPGTRNIQVGPPRIEKCIAIQTYRVKIVEAPDTIEDGVSVTFRAITEPPGFENSIVWLGSTKWGTVSPVMGQGATFTTVFNNTTGRNGQWLGTRCDDSRYGQDRKGGGIWRLGFFRCKEPGPQGRVLGRGVVFARLTCVKLRAAAERFCVQTHGAGHFVVNWVCFPP